MAGEGFQERGMERSLEGEWGMSGDPRRVGLGVRRYEAEWAGRAFRNQECAL